MFIGFYNYTVYLTYIGLISAICGMVEACEGNYKTAIVCLLVCGFCDMFDGTIARTNKKRSDSAKWFGGQIDSLCDMVCFGVFPAFLCYSLCKLNFITLCCLVFYILAAVIRLAYFNVQEIERAGEGHREYYLGLPVTSSALIMPMTLLITTLNPVRLGFLYPTVLAVVGFLFILKFKLKKPYLKGLLVLVVIGMAVCFLVYKYGGNITCMKNTAEIIANV